jgi:hypothetical protein
MRKKDLVLRLDDELNEILRLANEVEKGFFKGLSVDRRMDLVSRLIRVYDSIFVLRRQL